LEEVLQNCKGKGHDQGKNWQINQLVGEDADASIYNFFMFVDETERMNKSFICCA